MITSSFLVFFLVLCPSLLIIPGYDHQPPPRKHVAVFIFGDSLFDAGNNNYINTTTEFQSKFWPYGETFFKYPTGRRSNGRLIPDYIGFKEVAVACCGSDPFRDKLNCGGKSEIKEHELCENLEEYMFFDSDHTSERANKLIAELMWSGTPHVIAWALQSEATI
ncbi:GDSL esterase/lipase 1-like [Pistacia vera]|uniref:GDSL esterase/lipase 1-like n=1 Tax=Pistacia vera TaxID=55513 RepID=UPI0012631867|nr:GDSL esterase/lipase 1-like [Pistacia vera]